MKMALTGRLLSAEEAYTCGLITQVEPEDKIDEEVRKLADSIARVPPLTNMLSKRSINNYFEGLGILQAQKYAETLIRSPSCNPYNKGSRDYYIAIE